MTAVFSTDVYIRLMDEYPHLTTEEAETIARWERTAVGWSWDKVPAMVEQLICQRHPEAALDPATGVPINKEEHKMDANEIVDSTEHRLRITKIKAVRENYGTSLQQAIHVTDLLEETGLTAEEDIRAIVNLVRLHEDKPAVKDVVRHLKMELGSVVHDSELQIQRTDAQVDRLQEQKDQLILDLETTARELKAKEEQIERITVRLHELAESQGWCGQFDDEMVKYGLRPRLRKHNVRARMVKEGSERQEFFIEDYVVTDTPEEEVMKTMADHPGVKDLVSAGWELALAWVYEDRDNDDEDY